MKKTFLYLLAGLFLYATNAFAVSGFPSKCTAVNQTLTIANNEYPVTLPDGVGALVLQSRTAADFKLAFLTTETDTNYFTVKSGSVLNFPSLGLVNQSGGTLRTTIFFKSTTAGQVVEIINCN